MLVLEDFTTDNGMLTPTLKLKRRVVFDRYGAGAGTRSAGRQARLIDRRRPSFLGAADGFLPPRYLRRRCRVQENLLAAGLGVEPPRRQATQRGP